MTTEYTDLFNAALDHLVTTLSAVEGLVVVDDPRNIQPPCVLVNAPSFSTPAMANKFVKLQFPIQVLTLGPFNLDAQRNLLNQTALIMGAGIAVTDGRPISMDIGGTLVPAYELTVNMQAAS